jgi:hypothetical protein
MEKIIRGELPPIMGMEDDDDDSCILVGTGGDLLGNADPIGG